MDKPIDVSVERSPGATEPPESYFVPETDVFETPEELVLVADMPGVSSDGLSVTVEDSLLVMRGEAAERPRTDADVHQREFAVGTYFRSFRLPADYDTEKVAATLKHGVLTLRLPKSERLKPRRIEVKVE